MQCLGNGANLSLGEAARAIGVSVDTLRRWDRDGKLATVRDDAQPAARAADGGRAAVGAAAARGRPAHALSARNRFPGVVRSVEADGVMAIVEIEAGPFRVSAPPSRATRSRSSAWPRACKATATVKATSVMVERA